MRSFASRKDCEAPLLRAEMRWERSTTFDLVRAKDAVKDFVTSSMEVCCVEEDDAKDFEDMVEFCFDEAAEDRLVVFEGEEQLRFGSMKAMEAATRSLGFEFGRERQAL